MKTSMIPAVVLAFALGAIAAPTQHSPQDLAIRDGPGAIAPQFEANALKSAKTTSAETTKTTSKTSTKATSKTSTKKSKTTTVKSSSATATADSSPDDGASAATSSEAASAKTTSSKKSSSTKTTSKSASTVTGTAKASTTSKASSTGSSSGSSGGSLPASSGTSVLSAVQTIAAGDTFDGGMVMFDRGVSCTGQAEGGDSDAVFILAEGASISNVIIGPNQIEGIHCRGGCTLTNVWWSAVCEDAFTIKLQDAGVTTKIIGGGAFGAEDKVLQHNGAGTVSVSDFTVDNFGKLYRSCGNCSKMYARHVIMDGITATDGSVLAGINSNYGDSATITNTKTTGVDTICETFTGNSDGDEPTSNGSGADGTYCIYGSDVTSS